MFPNPSLEGIRVLCLLFVEKEGHHSRPGPFLLTAELTKAGSWPQAVVDEVVFGEVLLSEERSLLSSGGSRLEEAGPGVFGSRSGQPGLGTSLDNFSSGLKDLCLLASILKYFSSAIFDFFLRFLLFFRKLSTLEQFWRNIFT